MEYQYTNIEERPALQMILDSVPASSMSNKNLSDISYHPSEKWLKVWFDEALSAEDKARLDNIVSAAVTAGSTWRKEVGSEYFELSPDENKGWVLHGGRVKFNKHFSSVPDVTITAAAGDGTFDLTIRRVTETFFDFSVRAKVRGRGALTMIEFDWEAAA